MTNGDRSPRLGRFPQLTRAMSFPLGRAGGPPDTLIRIHKLTMWAASASFSARALGRWLARTRSSSRCLRSLRYKSPDVTRRVAIASALNVRSSAAYRLILYSHWAIARIHVTISCRPRIARFQRFGLGEQLANLPADVPVARGA